jgi:hypothetical protein
MFLVTLNALFLALPVTFSFYFYNIRSYFAVSLSLSLSLSHSLQASKCYNRFFELQHVNFFKRRTEPATVCLPLVHKRRTEPATVCLPLVYKRRTVKAIIYLPLLLPSIVWRCFLLPCLITLALGQGLQQSLSCFSCS